MTGIFALCILIGLFAIGFAWLLIDAAIVRYCRWRERRDMRVRNQRLRKYCITPQFGTKEFRK